MVTISFLANYTLLGTAGRHKLVCGMAGFRGIGRAQVPCTVSALQSIDAVQSSKGHMDFRNVSTGCGPDAV